MPARSANIDDRHVQAAQHLPALQLRLRAAGVHAKYELPEEWPPQLIVSDPSASSHEDVIHVAPSLIDSNAIEWCFLWDWAEWICKVDELDEAVRRIVEMLNRP
jgi:hypothetical protein